MLYKSLKKLVYLLEIYSSFRITHLRYRQCPRQNVEEGARRGVHLEELLEPEYEQAGTEGANMSDHISGGYFRQTVAI